MLTFTALQSEISGNVSTSGYVLGAIAFLVVAIVVFFGVRLFRAKKSNLRQNGNN